jgi:hypothetical protein
MLKERQQSVAPTLQALHHIAFAVSPYDVEHVLPQIDPINSSTSWFVANHPVLLRQRPILQPEDGADPF